LEGGGKASIVLWTGVEGKKKAEDIMEHSLDPRMAAVGAMNGVFYAGMCRADANMLDVCLYF